MHVPIDEKTKNDSPYSRFFPVRTVDVRLALVCCMLPFVPAPVAAEELAEGVRLYYSQRYKQAAPLLMRAARKGDAKGTGLSRPDVPGRARSTAKL